LDLFDNPSLAAFRAEVRAFIEANLPADLRKAVETGADIGPAGIARWQAILCKKGWGAPSWPKEHGGTGWSLAEQYIFNQEIAAAYAPGGVPFNIDMVGPLIIHHGNDDQKRRFLPKTLTGEIRWCQGFSEPNSGSDLASLQCRAVRDGDHYVINGTKLWQTLAMDADKMFGLFRTDSSGRKQEGITVLLVDMKAKGLSLRPIKLMDGSVEVAQCFFDDVRVPVADRVGEEGKGWSLAKFVLGLERLGIAEVARSKAMFARLKRIAVEERDGHRLIDENAFAELLVRLEADLLALDVTEFRFLFDPDKGGELGAEASILKLCGTVVQQRIAEATMEAAGYFALPAAGEDGANAPAIGPDFARGASEAYLNLRKISIYGGSNEIQRNIVSKAVLGL
jgi:alkylation response protein AidB-like acyl-CoA dehydrogenase